MENFNLAKSLSGASCFLLDEEETELLHVNFSFEKIHEDKLVRISFDGCRPIVGTDFYDVGTCKYNGRVHSIVASKENIVAALSSTQEPLIKNDSSNELHGADGVAVSAARTLDIAPVKRVGAFSHYSKHFLG